MTSIIDGDWVVADITFVARLNKYENYANVSVYVYNVGGERFYFDARPIDVVPGNIESRIIVEPPVYDVAVSRIGKQNTGDGIAKSVENIELVKRNINEFFAGSNVFFSQTAPRRVVFE